jgi:hypothetical protein
VSLVIKRGERQRNKRKEGKEEKTRQLSILLAGSCWRRCSRFLDHDHDPALPRREKGVRRLASALCYCPSLKPTSANAFLPSAPLLTVTLTLLAERLLLAVTLGELEMRLGMGDGTLVLG